MKKPGGSIDRPALSLKNLAMCRKPCYNSIGYWYRRACAVGGCPLFGGLNFYAPNRKKGVVNMVTWEALGVMISFGLLIIGIISLIIENKKK